MKLREFRFCRGGGHLSQRPPPPSDPPMVACETSMHFSRMRTACLFVNRIGGGLPSEGDGDLPSGWERGSAIHTKLLVVMAQPHCTGTGPEPVRREIESTVHWGNVQDRDGTRTYWFLLYQSSFPSCFRPGWLYHKTQCTECNLQAFEQFSENTKCS